MGLHKRAPLVPLVMVSQGVVAARAVLVAAAMEAAEANHHSTPFQVYLLFQSLAELQQHHSLLAPPDRRRQALGLRSRVRACTQDTRRGSTEHKKFL